MTRISLNICPTKVKIEMLQSNWQQT